ncbi:hypothetical protein LL998_34095 (plasmid) [Burkholderia ambifaria]|uniref:hypothetical protein n=1 Tax=Burkholderia ambifaria TaxID=152480 RepID=UPI001E4B71A8|nr:hypothetical protein [Burkholderia ambifaria]UEP39773.1 hypothetical protein LL998_34095 [Burkholderia ambifaria]
MANDSAPQLEACLPPAPEIVRRACDFDQATNVAAGGLPYGDTVIHNSAPYDSAPNMVGYDIAFQGPADYGLYIEYAALEPRPCEVMWDGKVIASAGLNQATGGWEEKFQQRHKEGVVSGDAGVHHLVISRGDVFPHIRTIWLELENPK